MSLSAWLTMSLCVLLWAVHGSAAVALSFALGLKLPPASSSQGWCHSGPFSKAPLQIQALTDAAPKQADVLEELLSDFCPFFPHPAEGGQSSGQFQGRPSEVWSQWQSQHHNQQSGDQHSHPQPSQTEVFQVRSPESLWQPFSSELGAVALEDQGAAGPGALPCCCLLPQACTALSCP